MISIINFAIQDSLISFVIVVARVYPCFFLIPAFLFGSIKGRIRACIVLVFSFFIYPSLMSTLSTRGLELNFLFFLILKEFAIGFFIGLLFTMPFWLFESVGALIDNQMGVLMGGQINNSILQTEITNFSQLYKNLVILVFFLNDSLINILIFISDSYYFISPLEFNFSHLDNWREVFMGVLKRNFTYLLIYSLPYILFLLIFDISIGVLNVFTPQLQSTLVTSPLKCLCGLLFIYLFLTDTIFSIEYELSKLADLSSVIFKTI
ncbi:type III secretion protein T [Kluyvera sp. 1366]|jgi:type III secretion protein T